MSLRREIAGFLEPLTRRVRGMVRKAVVTAVNDGLKTQGLQLRILSGQRRDDVEHYQAYGFSSVAFDDAEALVVHAGGNPNVPVVVATEDRRYRPTGFDRGEVLLYDDKGQRVALRRGQIEVLPDQGNTVELGGTSGNPVARKGDATRSTSTQDKTFWAWVDDVHKKVGTGTSITATKPTALTGKVNAGSSIVRADG